MRNPVFSEITTLTVTVSPGATLEAGASNVTFTELSVANIVMVNAAKSITSTSEKHICFLVISKYLLSY